jgi:hypothetical protein
MSMDVTSKNVSGHYTRFPLDPGRRGEFLTRETTAGPLSVLVAGWGRKEKPEEDGEARRVCLVSLVERNQRNQINEMNLIPATCCEMLDRKT